MVFSSFEFIFAFLPIAVLGYYLTYYLIHSLVGCFARYFPDGLSGYLTQWGSLERRLAHFWLIGASWYFYAQWQATYLLLLVGSIIINYLISIKISCKDADNISELSPTEQSQKIWLTIGVMFNIALLGYFKYTHFIVGDVMGFNIEAVILPLAISFFTFQQIAYLVDCYYPQRRPERGFSRYCLFVSFFPQLIAGPIVHHQEMMPQFKQFHINVEHLAKGLAIFSIGLFKKVVLADSLAVWANAGFAQSASLNFIEAWLTGLCYTFQLYFDFSGYADMAIGIALLFNIVLPLNFSSPYRALSIQEFWRHWHMTLSRWLKNYVYFPLGGSRLGALMTLRNLFIVALISGIWHGAGWTFIIWGLMHAIALITHRIWQIFSQSRSWKVPRVFAWLMTFLFVVIAWVMFRAESVTQALQIYQAMFDFSLSSMATSLRQADTAWQSSYQALSWQLLFADLTPNTLLREFFIGISFAICLILPNSQTLIGLNTAGRLNITRLLPTLALTLMALAALCLLALGSYSEFIYFNF